MERVVLNEVILVRYVGHPDGSGHWVYDGKVPSTVEFAIPKGRRRKRIDDFSDAIEYGSEMRSGREVYWWTTLATRAHIERALGKEAEAILEPGRDFYAVRLIGDDEPGKLKRRRGGTHSDKPLPRT